MKWCSNFDFFMFDMDGLLINSEPIHYKAFLETFNNKGCNLNLTFEEYCKLAHETKDGLKNLILNKKPELFQNCSWESLNNEKRQYYLSLLTALKDRKIQLMEGVENLLNFLKQKKCVVTNSTKEQVEIIRKKLPILNKIEFWVTREDYKNPKPDPEPYLYAIEHYSKKGDRIIGFEDTHRGVLALSQTVATPVMISKISSKPIDTIFHFKSFLEIPSTFSFS